MFNVLIPVSNRVDYISQTIKTVSTQKYDDLRIIVCDDSSVDGTSEIISQLQKNDSRIEHYRHSSVLGMKNNFEYAINCVNDGYVLILGGDDGLMPNALENISSIMIKEELDLFTWSAPIYSFPGVYGENGNFFISHKSGYKLVDSSDYLRRQARNLYYLTDPETPMIYVKGVASHRLISKVKKKSKDGNFYSCPTPDGYSGIVLAGEVDFFGFSYHPYSIFGTSQSSQGLSYLSSKKDAKEQSETFFKHTKAVPMHDQLANQPYSPLITLMTADYLLTAAMLDGNKCAHCTIDYDNLLKKSLDELSSGIYSNDRLHRELEILRAISIKHDKLKYFERILSKSRRNAISKFYSKDGITPNVVILDAKSYEIDGIHQAAHVAEILYTFISSLSFKRLAHSLLHSIIYKISTKIKLKKFPKI